MKKIYVTLLIPLILFSDLNIERVNSVLSAVRFNNRTVSYYTPNRTLFVKLKTLKSKSPKDADILIFPTNGDMGRMVIVDNYETLKKNRDSIGAIYIKKGRTQIIFVKERLEAKGLKLPKEYDRYIIKECYIKEVCFLN